MGKLWKVRNTSGASVEVYDNAGDSELKLNGEVFLSTDPAVNTAIHAQEHESIRLGKATLSTVIIGDSRTQFSSMLFGPPNKRPQGVMPIPITGLSGTLAAPNTIVSSMVAFGFTPGVTTAGTIAWDNTAKTLRLTATGDTAGTPVVITGSGYYPVYSGDGVRCLLCAIATGTDTRVPNSATTSSTFNTAAYYTSSTNAFRTAATWALMLNGQSLFDPIYNLGISGDTAGGVNDRLSDISACDPDVILYHVGINNVGTTTVPSATELVYQKANIDWMVANTSARIFVETVGPSSTYETAVERLNQELAKYCRANYPEQVVVIDGVKFLTNLATGAYDTDKYTDTVHYNGYGSYLVGKAEDAALRGNVGYKPRAKVPNVLDVYNATSNHYGNLLGASGAFQVGATAADGASGFSGSNAPTGWTQNRGGGAQTTAISYQPFTDGRNGNFLRLAVANSGAIGYQRLYQLITGITGLAAGQKIQFEAEFALSAATKNLNYFRFFFGNDNSGSLWQYTMDCNTIDLTNATSATLQTNGINMGSDTLVIRSMEPFILPAGTWNSLACHIFYQLRPDASSAAQIDLLNISARIVE